MTHHVAEEQRDHENFGHDEFAGVQRKVTCSSDSEKAKRADFDISEDVFVFRLAHKKTKDEHHIRIIESGGFQLNPNNTLVLSLLCDW